MAADIQSLLSQGVQSPLIQMILQAVLAGLVPGEQAARTGLRDEFRKAGALRSGAFGRAVPQLESELAGKRGQVTAQTTAAMLGPIMSALLDFSRQQQQASQFQQQQEQQRAIYQARINAGLLSSGGGGGGGITSGSARPGLSFASPLAQLPQAEWEAQLAGYSSAAERAAAQKAAAADAQSGRREPLNLDELLTRLSGGSSFGVGPSNPIYSEGGNVFSSGPSRAALEAPAINPIYIGGREFLGDEFDLFE